MKPSFLALALLVTAGPAGAAPLVLYDPGAAPPPPATELKSTTTAIAPLGTAQPCGLTTPCTDLNTATQAHLSLPFSSDVSYGLSGEASAGVSNHGQGGSVGVLGWVKDGDTTLSLGVSVGATRWNGQKFTYVPVPQHP
jgi:hypothetical protein